MIRIPLTFHAPEVVYEYLENKFGPLNMLVKKGQALVTFDDLETNEAAISLQRGQAIVRGHPLRMFRYNDGDLNVPEPVPLASSAPSAPPAPPAAPNPDFSMMMSIQPEHSAPGLITLPAASSETAKMVDQAITVLDPNDPLQVTTRKHFKDVIQYVAKYTPLINAAKSRAKELQAGGGEGMVQELLKAHQSQLGEVKNGVMGLYKRARNQASRFGKEKQRCQIDLEPSLQPEPVESAPLYAGKLSSYLHFATKDQTVEIKRIAILNEKQFVCSSYLQQRERRKTAKGKIKVYGLDEEFQVMSTVLPEGAYGLSVIDKYLLVGNLQGSVSFWNATLGPFTPQHPFEMSQKLHEGYIFDLLRNGTAPGGFGVVTLGTDFQIKLFQVSEDLITDDIVTLFFKEEAVFSQGREIMGIDLLQERAKLVAGSYNRLITYDLPTKKVISESLQRSNIYRIKRMRENLLSLADTSSVTFADPRTNGAVASCALSQQAKALCVVNENVACYGTNDGQLGMVDMRKCSQPFWRDQGTHHSRIYDILRMGERLISGDQRGLLVGWSSAEVN